MKYQNEAMRLMYMVEFENFSPGLISFALYHTFV